IELVGAAAKVKERTHRRRAAINLSIERELMQIHVADCHCANRLARKTMEGINAFQRKGAAQAVLEVDADVGSGAEKVSKVTVRKTAPGVETQAPAFEVGAASGTATAAARQVRKV